MKWKVSLHFVAYLKKRRNFAQVFIEMEAELPACIHGQVGTNLALYKSKCEKRR